MAEDVLRDASLSLKTAVLRAADLPLSVFSSLPQVSLSSGTKKLVAVAAFGAFSVLFLARRFRRRKGKKKVLQEQKRSDFLSTLPPLKGSSCVVPPSHRDAACTRPNLSLSLNSKSSFSRHAASNGGLQSKLSGSLQSLTSVKSVNSCSEGTNESACWDGMDDGGDLRNIATTPENLYMIGMELFEEALRRWEEALNFRSRLADDEAECSSVKLGAGDAIAEETVEDIISGEFIRKLESLLQRAYRLQEEFEGALGFTAPSSHHSMKHTEGSVREDLDDSCWRDTVSIGSTDSFVSAAELSEHKSALGLSSLCRYPFYEEALQMAEDGKISCRVLRTEMLECLGDTDFLAKLHCIRQACQVILQEISTRKFLADTGKKILSSIIVKASKNPKRFEEVYEEMIGFLEQREHWENTEAELSTRGVKHLNFYDIVLDFILMDSFEDLENPPMSITNVVNNRWLNSAFKETAVASSCWSVLKQKRQHVKDQDGFIAHFYMVCEHISPELAWGFLGPKSSLHDFCCFFKEQVLLFLKDIFDLEKVRYSSVDTLAEDVLHLLHYRAELLLSYSGSDVPHHANGCVGTTPRLMSGALPETWVQ
ncbi:LOW QUALITY PROTEIN: mitoguardin 1 [Ictalurus furcatus]|uniref:LOW QUALITY PROTEIN: mitoguardin 1 n=1 Tax=Ictalurus furcatus TaxID=66913 RepID=UPI00234FD672|nr:LOW QUALITY PROTEIN: mitoguardin 1 [Ictalurus furcatus]